MKSLEQRINEGLRGGEGGRIAQIERSRISRRAERILRAQKRRVQENRSRGAMYSTRDWQDVA